MFQLSKKLVATLSPASHNGEIYNQLTVFDSSDPSAPPLKTASCPLFKYEQAGGFKVSNLCYDKERDKLRAVTCCLGNNDELSLQELSLDKNLPAGTYLKEIPAFVETKALPDGARDVKVMH